MSIHTLVDDIHGVLGSREELSPGCSSIASIMTGTGKSVSKLLLKREEKKRPENTIYFSEVGDPCARKMWYKYHKPAAAEAFTPATLIKFSYGDILEELVLGLAEEAGHSVTDRQKVVEYKIPGTTWTIRGRIDAMIDGVPVDVKSVTARSEAKFDDIRNDDPFGYYGQLNGYANVLRSMDAGFLTIQKELGHIKYFPIDVDTEAFAHNIARAVRTLEGDVDGLSIQEPVKASSTSKNMKLCTMCSYCQFKKECFPGVRAFAYSNKVEWLSKVVDVPRVPEITV